MNARVTPDCMDAAEAAFLSAAAAAPEAPTDLAARVAELEAENARLLARAVHAERELRVKSSVLELTRQARKDERAGIPPFPCGLREQRLAAPAPEVGRSGPVPLPDHRTHHPVECDPVAQPLGLLPRLPDSDLELPGSGAGALGGAAARVELGGDQLQELGVRPQQLGPATVVEQHDSPGAQSVCYAGGREVR